MGDGMQTAWPRVPTAALTASESSGRKSQTPGILPLLCPGITHSRVALIVMCSLFDVCPPLPFLSIKLIQCWFSSFRFRLDQFMDFKLNCHCKWCYRAKKEKKSDVALIYAGGPLWIWVNYGSCSICFHFCLNQQTECLFNWWSKCLRSRRTLCSEHQRFMSLWNGGWEPLCEPVYCGNVNKMKDHPLSSTTY